MAKRIDCRDWPHIDALFAARFTHHVSLPKHADTRGANEWCQERFGMPDAWNDEVPGKRHGDFDPDGLWGINDGFFWFTTERDAFEFKIRWG